MVSVAHHGLCMIKHSVTKASFLYLSHLVGVWIVEEIGPVWIRLHEPELKQLPETQLKDVEGDLQGEAQPYVSTDADAEILCECLL